MKLLKTTSILILSLFFFSCGEDDDSSIQAEPIYFTGKDLGCWERSVFKALNTDTNNTIWLKILSDNLANYNLSSNYKSFSVTDNNLNIVISEYDAPTNGFLFFCDDIHYSTPNLIDEWSAISGNIKFKISEDAESEASQTINTISIQLENVIFTNGNNQDNKLIRSLIIENINVSFMPG